jgi:hypothetical protein
MLPILVHAPEPPMPPFTDPIIPSPTHPSDPERRGPPDRDPSRPTSPEVDPDPDEPPDSDPDPRAPPDGEPGIPPIGDPWTPAQPIATAGTRAVQRVSSS